MFRRAQVVATLIELLGMVGIVAGIGMLSVPIATIVGGVGLVLIGLSLGVQTGGAK